MWEEYDVTRPIPQDVFDEAYGLLCRSLPKEEWREEAVQRALLQNPAYKLRLLSQEGRVIALLAVWEWESLRYMEHLAVDGALRGQGLGGRAVLEYISGDARPLVLEVEPGESTIAARRIGFYERLGLFYNAHAYKQPPLQPGFSPLRLQLMSWPGPLSEAEFASVRRFLYENVYGITKHG